ncbi:MAG: site-specific DNA-methyltransferase [Nitrospira sp. SB0677_bin_15]|nr:site-specific DNA-methyltransferase [Nitrospira sp. SB0677_bin_15]MYH01487.1 site-specific DNA-methyltransferase [Nitrospira sp. SB0675_bin_23]
MAKPKKSPKKSAKRDIETYAHTDKERVNNPPVGLVTPDTDRDSGKKTYAYDPHLDPQLQWAGKAEHTSFEVPTVSLHVHERIDPRTIVEAVRKRNGAKPQMALFAAPEENPPIRQAIEFYKHRHNWTNRLIAGDSLLVMNSLLEKEGLGGQVQMVYIDPPYGIRYGSNFQPFVNKRDVTDGKDEDLTQEPETIRAFRDTWELGIHSYLAYLRDRLLLARELLVDSGSCFVQIGDENVHRAGMVLDDVFGSTNRVATISFATTSGSSTAHLPQVADYLLWYAKDKDRVKYRQLYETLTRTEIIDYFSWHVMVELPDGSCRKPTDEERFDPDRYLPLGARLYERTGLDSQGVSTTGRSEPYVYNNRTFHCAKNRQWSISNPEGLDQLAKLGRLEALEGQDSLRWKKYEDEVPGRRINNIWPAQMFPSEKKYVVETSIKAIQRCILMTTDPGDLVFDPTCGSGTTAHVAEQWGRRWITCDTSRVALTLTKQRLMTSVYDYYKLAHSQEGVGSGFNYKTVPKVSPKILANEEPSSAITRHDQPLVDKTKTRVTGPFTVEAVPAPAVKPLDEIVDKQPADHSVARTGQTLRQADWRDELFKTGIRGKAGQRISFARLEPLPGTRWLHAEGETRPDSTGADRIRDGGTAENPERVVISFGPDHAPMEQRQVALAIEEAQTLVPKPTIIIFAAFQFDPEAAKDIDETNWPGVTLLKAQMNADLLTNDLKKKRASNESFWLIGQPDVELEGVPDREDKGKLRVSVRGFDYYNTKTGNVESGGRDRIAMWMLDPDYDGRSLFPRQVFFPMAGDEDGWAKLAKNLKAEIDTDLIETYRGTTSLPFVSGENKRIAVKIIDDRGIESLKIIEVE